MAATGRKSKEEIIGDHSAAFANWLPSATKDEINWLLRKHDLKVMHRELLLIEVANRGRKEHWSLTPAFYVLCATAIFAAIAAWPIVREWVWHPSGQGALSQPLEISPKPTPTSALPTAAALPLPQESASISSTPTPNPPEPDKELPQESPSG